ETAGLKAREKAGEGGKAKELEMPVAVPPSRKAPKPKPAPPARPTFIPAGVLIPPIDLLHPAPPEDGDAGLAQIEQMGQTLIEGADYQRSTRALPIALGKNLEGDPVVADLAKMPHLLIAGVTGSGKSVCINTIITSLIYTHPPEKLKLLMIDPKMVELSMYAALPHLGLPVVTNHHKAAS